MKLMQTTRLLATIIVAGVSLGVGATPGLASPGRSGAFIEGRLEQTLQVSAAAAKEISALLAKNQFSRETAGLLVQMVLSNDGAAFAGKRRSSGGWCWNEDGTFYGSLPCPKEIANRDRTTQQTKAAPRPGAQPLTLRKGQVSKAVADEVNALLGRATYSKETAGLLVQIALNQQGDKFAGYKKGGGWCWNDDGSFKGSLPCPK